MAFRSPFNSVLKSLSSFSRSGPLGFFSSASRPAARSVSRSIRPTVSRAVSSFRSPVTSRTLSNIGRASSFSPFSIGRSISSIRPTGVKSALSKFSSTASNIARGIGQNVSRQFTKQPVNRTPSVTVGRNANRTPSFSVGGGAKGVAGTLSSLAKGFSGGGVLGSFGNTISRALGGSPQSVKGTSGITQGADFLRSSKTPSQAPMGGGLQSALGNIIAPVKSFFGGQGGKDVGGVLRGAGLSGPGLTAGNLGGQLGKNLLGGGLNQGIDQERGDALLGKKPGVTQPSSNLLPPGAEENLVNVPGTSFYMDKRGIKKGDDINPDIIYQKDPATGQFVNPTHMNISKNSDAISRAFQTYLDQGLQGSSPDYAGYPIDPRGTSPFTPIPQYDPDANQPSGPLDQFMSAFKSGDFQSMKDKFDNYKDMFEQGKGLLDQLGFSMDGGGGDEMPDTGALSGAQDALMGQGGQAPLDPLITQRLQELLSSQFNDLSQEEIDAILSDLDDSEQKELDFIIDQYKNLRPGADIESDSSFRRDIGEVREKYAKLKQEATARGRRDTRNQFNQDLLSALQVATGQSENINQGILDLISAQQSLKSGSPLNSFGSSSFPSTILLGGI